MQTFIIILLILAFLSFVLQLTLFEQDRTAIVFCIVAAVGIYFMYPFAIEQSYSKFQQLMQNQHKLSNIMVVQIIECLLGLLFSIFLIRMFYGEKVNKVFKYFKFFPGIIIFPALFYAESAIFLNVTGVDFKILAIIVAVVLPATIFLINKSLKYLVPEYDLRLELKFMLHILQLIVAVIISIRIFRLPTTNLVSEFYIKQLLAFFGVVLLFGILGFFRYNRKKM